MIALALAFGALVGFALGMTGGGGGIFAVPLLVYGLSIAPREAVGISLAAVGGTALFGAIPRLLGGQVEIRTGLLFAVAGMLGAPLGSYLATLMPERLLLVLFAGLMLVVAQRMWTKARNPAAVTGTCASEAQADQNRACLRDDTGQLRLTSRCMAVLVVVGILTGVLAGLFGVGGGFVIVPALVLVSGMPMHAAVGTSLFVIVLVSISGVASHFAQGNPISVEITLLFLLGGCVGMYLGGIVAKRLQATTLQKVFSVAIVLVAAFVILKTTLL